MNCNYIITTQRKTWIIKWQQKKKTETVKKRKSNFAQIEFVSSWYWAIINEKNKKKLNVDGFGVNRWRKRKRNKLQILFRYIFNQFSSEIVPVLTPTPDAYIDITFRAYGHRQSPTTTIYHRRLMIWLKELNWIFFNIFFSFLFFFHGTTPSKRWYRNAKIKFIDWHPFPNERWTNSWNERKKKENNKKLRSMRH